MKASMKYRCRTQWWGSRFAVKLKGDAAYGWPISVTDRAFSCVKFGNCTQATFPWMSGPIHDLSWIIKESKNALYISHRQLVFFIIESKNALYISHRQLVFFIKEQQVVMLCLHASIDKWFKVPTSLLFCERPDFTRMDDSDSDNTTIHWIRTSWECSRYRLSLCPAFVLDL